MTAEQFQRFIEIEQKDSVSLQWCNERIKEFASEHNQSEDSLCFDKSSFEEYMTSEHNSCFNPRANEVTLLPLLFHF